LLPLWLHHSPPCAPPSQTEEAPVPAGPQLQKPLRAGAGAGTGTGCVGEPPPPLLVHQRPPQPESQLLPLWLHHSPPCAPPSQTEEAPVPAGPQLQKPLEARWRPCSSLASTFSMVRRLAALTDLIVVAMTRRTAMLLESESFIMECLLQIVVSLVNYLCWLFEFMSLERSSPHLLQKFGSGNCGSRCGFGIRNYRYSIQ
jgi:hypothetical protein